MKSNFQVNFSDWWLRLSLVKLPSDGCHWTLLMIKSTLVQVMALCIKATSHYLNQCWPRYSLPYDVTGPHWVNSLWQSDAIWRHRSGSILAQVMAFCLMAPSHYLNQCWLLIGEVLWHWTDRNFTASAQATILFELENCDLMSFKTFSGCPKTFNSKDIHKT